MRRGPGGGAQSRIAKTFLSTSAPKLEISKLTSPLFFCGLCEFLRLSRIHAAESDAAAPRIFAQDKQ
jgi:hypothetical protein